MFKSEDWIPVTGSTSTWLMLNNLGNSNNTVMFMRKFSYDNTSTSHKALDDMADVAEVLAVKRRNTLCFFLYSSIVRNFSCSAWKSLTTSPPFKISSSFSLCSKNKEIFQLVWELTTLTYRVRMLTMSSKIITPTLPLYSQACLKARNLQPHGEPKRK